MPSAALWIGTLALAALPAAGCAASGGQVPELVVEAFKTLEPDAMSRAVFRCGTGDNVGYKIVLGTGYEEITHYFSSSGERLGEWIVPDTGPESGSFNGVFPEDCVALDATTLKG